MALQVAKPYRKRHRGPVTEYDAVASAMDQIETELGGRGKLIATLVATPPDRRFTKVVELFADPRNDATNIAKLCAEGGVSFGELLEALKRGTMVTAVLQSIQQIAARMPLVVIDLLNRSVPHQGVCPRCYGHGNLLDPEKKTEEYPNGIETTCPVCRGAKTILTEPDLDRQQFVLEKLTPLGPAKVPLVSIDQSEHRSVTMDVSAEAHARLLTAVGKVLHGRDRVAPPLALPDYSDYTPDAESTCADGDRANGSQ